MRTLIRLSLIPLLALLTACAPVLPPAESAPPDAELRSRVMEAIDSQNISDTSHVYVTVDKGIVDVTGWVNERPEIDMIVSAVSGVDGVRAVRNKLWVPTRDGSAAMPAR
ncbi:MAG: BON domain-containing protein [Ectothiorhodospiraceae bacterium]|jgi:hypothetical protein